MCDASDGPDGGAMVLAQHLVVSRVALAVHHHGIRIMPHRLQHKRQSLNSSYSTNNASMKMKIKLMMQIQIKHTPDQLIAYNS